jgi:amino acid adenylation domain-containing protein
MLEQLQMLLSSGMKDPNRRSSPEHLFTQRDRDLLREWNNTAVAYPRQQCIHELFEEQVTKTPEAIAVQFGSEKISYRQLEERSRALALQLQSRGIGPDQIVGLCVYRSVEMVVGLVGILRAGAAYLPLDPDYPAERLHYMVEESAPACVLASSRTEQKLADLKLTCALLLSDTHRPEIGEGISGALSREVHSRNLAYVLYTSGSTGKPKGAMIEHQALCNRIVWMQREYGMGPGDRVLQKTPFSFDVSGWEFHWPLIVGATIVLAEPGKHKDPEYIRDIIQQARITHLHFVPSMLQVFLQVEGLSRCNSVKAVFCSGEALTVQQQDLFFQRFDRAALHNLYGPTEAAIDVTYWPCRPGVARVPIGRPIANVQLYVVDANLQLLPPGLPGELCIGGEALARGYIRQPLLTSTKFVENPFAPAEKVYRTGDLARWLPDGEIEFLGRLDQQVKLRGFRIELGEIEAAIATIRGVKEAAVILAGEAENKLLVGFYVAARGTNLDLRKALLQRLPDYMVPSYFIQIEQVPLTSSGKVDRRALEAMYLRSRSATPRSNPTSETERALLSLWQQELGRNEVGIEQNFFELGGHSLLAINLMQKINRAFAVTLPLATLFECPTIREVASRLQKVAGLPSSEPTKFITPLQRSGSGVPIYFCPGAGGNTLQLLELSKCMGGDRPFLVFEPMSLGFPAAGERSVKELAEFFIEELLRVYPQPSYVLGGWSMGGVVAFEMACGLTKRGAQVDGLVLIDSYLQEHFAAFGITSPASPSTNVLQSNANNSDPGNSVLDLDVKALQKYQPSQVYSGEVLFLHATRYPLPRNSALVPADAIRIQERTIEIWSSYITRIKDGFQPMDADHFGILSPPTVQKVGEAISGYLKTAQVPA